MVGIVIGTSQWFELPVHDILDAMSFYEGLFGWTFCRLSDPVLPDYRVIQQGEAWIGGLRPVAVDGTGPKPGEGAVIYFNVALLAPAVARAKELGAKLVGDRVELGKSRGVYQWIRDREGNLVALWAPQ